FNTIRNCKINGNSSSLNCLFSSGNSNAASNKFNKIFTSDFFDFFSNVSASLPSGIHLSTGSSDWIIGGIGLGNNFYQTAARHPSSTPALTTAVNFKAIYINDLNGKGFYIIENNIGGNITGITGSIFELGNTSTNVGITCRGIEVNAVSNSTLSYIQGNIIKNMVVFSTVTNFYAGIFTTNGHIDISHNIIGSDIGNHSLTMTHLGTTALANVYGIRISGTTGFIKNNVIGSFSGQQLNASGNMQILSIYLTGTFTDPFYVENNFIGSNTTANSIQSMFSSIGGINVMGIVASGATGNQLHFTKNWIRNLSVLSTFNGANNGVKGIYVTGVSTARTHITQNIISDLYSESRNPNVNQSASINGITTVTSSSGSQFIANNTIYNLILTPTLSVASAAIGIYYGSTNTASNNSIENNHIFGLGSNQNNDNAILTGISAGAGSTTFPLKLVNNMISIGSDSTGASYIGSAQINGVLKTVGMIALYHNTINIHGAGVLNNAVNTFAFRRTNTAIDTLLNNIFVNKRINATSGGGHFTLGVDTSLTLTSDYNALFSNSAIALSNASSLLNLSDWTLAYNIDLNSVSTTLVFQNDSNLHLSGSSLGNVILGCNPLSFVLLDFDGQIRNNVKTYMGADEAISHLLPIELAWFNATRDGEDVRLNWASVSEINSDYFEVQASIDGNSFEPITQINAAGNSTKMIRYSAFHNQALQFAASQSAIFYRLKLVDIDGSFEYSAIRKVDVKGDQPSFGMAYPNPFVNEINVDFVNENADQVIFNLYDQNGMKILSTSGVALNTTFTINDLGYLKAGFYLLRIYTNTHTHTYKVWKKE
ncbi:MAG: T9SS type A sorting domain-containing protein, partial [Bacteroidota bacterium]|nr:T9SS type A sorting domain-containing protein [Bacteroidota bacterium]